MLTTIVFVLALVIGIIIKIAITLEDRRTVTAVSRGTAATFEGIELCDGQISRHGHTHPIRGVTAVVETVGQSRRRVTATRLATVGVFAFAATKKVDDRELYLTITGPDFQWDHPIPAPRGPLARQFAAAITTAGLTNRSPATPHTAPPPHSHQPAPLDRDGHA